MGATALPEPIVIQSAEKVFRFATEREAAAYESTVKDAGGEAVRLAPELPAIARSLYDLETHLTALADTTELVDPEQEAAFLADFQDALVATKEKRDRVGQFIAHCEGLVSLADAEIARLTRRKASVAAAIERVERYVVVTIQNQGADEKGKYKKLEGNTHSFAVRRNPPSVSILNEAAVPASFKTVSVTLPAELWEELLDNMDLEARGKVLDAVKRPDSAVSKTAVKAAIEAAVPDWKNRLADPKSTVSTETVPGAAIAAGALKLVRE